MRHSRKIIQFLTKGAIVLFFYLFLTGQDTIRGRNKIAPAELDLDMFKFDHPKTISSGVTEYIFYLWILGGGVLIIILLTFYRKYQIWRSFKHAQAQESAFHLSAHLSHLHISQEEKQLLEKIAKSSDPTKILSLVESVKQFEKKVRAFKRQKKINTPTQSLIYQLRKHLGFDYTNLDHPFLSTQMLSPNVQLHCTLPRAKKFVAFSIPVLTVEEDRILLKPPTLKGKPVDLRRFSYLLCQVRRGHESDYRFKLRIKDQLFGDLNAVVVEHTYKIKKLFIRENKRVPIQIPAIFYALSEKQLYAHSGKYEYLREHMALPQFEGKIINISSGGLKIRASHLPSELNTEHLLLFHLKGASLKDDLLVRILAIVDQEEGYEMHARFFHLRELTRLKVNKFIHRIRKNAKIPPVQTPPAPSTAHTRRVSPNSSISEPEPSEMVN